MDVVRLVPWLQVEINRDLYLSERWFDYETLSMKTERLQELNTMFKKTVVSLFKKLF